MQIKEHHKRDFAAYIKFCETADKGFNPWGKTTFEQGKQNTIVCFIRSENGEANLKPMEPELLSMAILGKRLLNWQIKEWVAGVAEWTIFIDDLKEEFNYLPDWVWVAVHNAAWRKRFAERGYLKIMEHPIK